ncbi:MAG: hypothetical protein IT306_17570 [Chloroflexi bacterium]|nr:hypothetical protein [Chloroflexota bacterium]
MVPGLRMLEQGLTDYIMPDVVWTGGISELLRIATLAEAYHMPISPHVDFDVEKLQAHAVYRRPGT